MKHRVAFVLIVLAILTRLLPHPPNFTPITAAGLFGASVFGQLWLGIAIPLLSLFLSDLYINNVVYDHFYDGFVWFGSLWVYLAFGMVSVLGRLMLHEKTTGIRVVIASLSASTLFFLVTNFGVWLTSGMYPLTAEGLLACYVAGIPFFGNTLLGDLFYSAVLFGGYAWTARLWKQPQQAIRSINK
ncbi:MAG: hypothetical protein NZM43_02565 [Saprospiraceae bacterium]|nr:hypothetical protein [Saprospiraceae bacterium]MDW8483184.1 DUF6580 family putative transport protein [Saprospiraceae bacterium]